MTNWMLARFPRSIVVSATALFRTLIVSLILFALVLAVTAIGASAVSAVYWVGIITGSTVSSDTTLIGLQASCLGALSFPAGIFVYLAWHMLGDADKELPRREKKP